MAGIRDSGSVLSLGFSVGLALLWENFGNEVAKFDASIRVDNYRDYMQRKFSMASEGIKLQPAILDAGRIRAELALKRLVLQVQWIEGVVNWNSRVAAESVESNIKYAAQLTEADAHWRTWNMEIYRYMMEAIGSISGGGPHISGASQPSAASNIASGVLGGAASGVSIGSSIGGTLGGAATGATLATGASVAGTSVAAGSASVGVGLVSGISTGAATGAASTSWGGPLAIVGALVGAIIGGVAGALSS